MKARLEGLEGRVYLRTDYQQGGTRCCVVVEIVLSCTCMEWCSCWACAWLPEDSRWNRQPQGRSWSKEEVPSKIQGHAHAQESVVDQDSWMHAVSTWLVYERYHVACDTVRAVPMSWHLK